jgi:hypothetical protein
MSSSPSAPPWYCFLYRLFGAQGTFWLWVVAAIAMWWTGGRAVVRLRNLESQHLTVGQVVQERRQRWVVLAGLELDLDRRLFAKDAVDGTPLARVLLDADDPAARCWSAILAAAERARGKKETEHAELRELRAQVLADPKAYLPAPGMGILLIGDEPLAPEPVRSDETAPTESTMARYEALLAAWTDLVIARVHPGAECDGLLDEAPPFMLENLERRGDVRLASQALRLGRRPRDLELYVFAAALALVLFLATGYVGVTRWERAVARAAAG